jgi:16S rRNA (guanine527-N7)-methyltransferase
VGTELKALPERAEAMLGIRLTARQKGQFSWYAQELIDWNTRFNLTAVTDAEEIEMKHFLDSLTCLLATGTPVTGRVADIGTGAGFPGLPLKIVSPDFPLVLVESTRKKVDFCQHVVKGLQLERVAVLHARAEEVGQQEQYRGGFDWVLARAVANLPVLVEYMLPLLKIGGKAVAQKGETAPAEVHMAEPALRILGGRVVQLIGVELPKVTETRYLVLIEKIGGTPAKYPRRPGMPMKRPLVSE